MLKTCLVLARAVDALNDHLALLAQLAVVASCLISAGNALIRYGFSVGSNGWLEIQWYLFAACVMLGTSQVLRLNEHVRVDILYGRASGRRQALIDTLGLAFFLLPVMLTMAALSWPLFAGMWASGEMSPNAGGLVRWPVMLSLPLGFALVSLQGLSELVKRVAWLRGLIDLDLHYERPLQ